MLFKVTFPRRKVRLRESVCVCLKGSGVVVILQQEDIHATQGHFLRERWRMATGFSCHTLYRQYVDTWTLRPSETDKTLILKPINLVQQPPLWSLSSGVFFFCLHSDPRARVSEVWLVLRTSPHRASGCGRGLGKLFLYGPWFVHRGVITAKQRK